MTRLGARLLEDLLALDAGYDGPVVSCGAGHQASLSHDHRPGMRAAASYDDLARSRRLACTVGGGILVRDRRAEIFLAIA
jgi:hypothetical protein